jgi:hypothetical protein
MRTMPTRSIFSPASAGVLRVEAHGRVGRLQNAVISYHNKSNEFATLALNYPPLLAVR